MNAATTKAAIAASGLTKDYGDGRGCRGVSLRIEDGEAFGFLGPNGAGKSTIVKMLVGLITPTSGRAEVYGHPAGSLEARKQLGYLPELFRYPMWLTGAEAIRLHAKLCGLDRDTTEKRCLELLDQVGIGKRGFDRIKNYSKGMQQRLGLACALVNDPKLIVLDEPASALDPVGRNDVKQLLKQLKAQGKTIFLNSHLLEDVEELCDRIALLNNGQVLQDGSLSDVLREQSRWHVRIGGLTPFFLSWLGEMMETPIRVAAELAVPPGSDSLWVELELRHEEEMGRFNYLLAEQGLTLYEATRAKSKLGDWFIESVSGLEHRGERK